MLKTSAWVLSLAAAAAAALIAASTRQHGNHAAPPPSRIDVPPSGVTLPMKDYGGRPVVDVRVDGKGPYPFILDTGASITVIGAELDRELSLAATAGVHAASPGGGAAPPIVTVASLRLGDATIGGFLAAVMPLAEFFKSEGAPQGVLSASSFPGCLVTFDYPGKRITIEPGALPAADSRTIFEYADDDTLPTIPIRVAGHETRVHVDTGSGSTLTLPRRFMTELPLKSTPRDSGAARLPGGTFPVSAAAIDGALEIGSATIDLPECRFSDVQLGGKLGPGNIGYPILKDFVVTLDSKNRRVRLAR
jgi:Aspartyl protease